MRAGEFRCDIAEDIYIFAEDVEHDLLEGVLCEPELLTERGLGELADGQALLRWKSHDEHLKLQDRDRRGIGEAAEAAMRRGAL